MNPHSSSAAFIDIEKIVPGAILTRMKANRIVTKRRVITVNGKYVEYVVIYNVSESATNNAGQLARMSPAGHRICTVSTLCRWADQIDLPFKETVL